MTLVKQIIDLQKQIYVINRQIEELQKSCPHLNITKILHSGRKAKCDDCLKTLYEYCPNSPTRFCWYNEDGKATDYHDKCKYCQTMMEYP